MIRRALDATVALADRLQAQGFDRLAAAMSDCLLGQTTVHRMQLRQARAAAELCASASLRILATGLGRAFGAVGAA